MKRLRNEEGQTPYLWSFLSQSGLTSMYSSLYTLFLENCNTFSVTFCIKSSDKQTKHHIIMCLGTVTEVVKFGCVEVVCKYFVVSTVCMVSPVCRRRCCSTAAARSAWQYRTTNRNYWWKSARRQRRSSSGTSTTTTPASSN